MILTPHMITQIHDIDNAGLVVEDWDVELPENPQHFIFYMIGKSGKVYEVHAMVTSINEMQGN